MVPNTKYNRKIISGYEISFHNIDNTKLNPLFSNTNKIFDDFFPYDTIVKYQDTLNNIIDITGHMFPFYKSIIQPLTLAIEETFRESEAMVSTISKRSTRLYFNEQELLKIDKKIRDVIKDETIPLLVSYPFKGITSIMFYEAIHFYKLLGKNNNTLIISKNSYAIDTIIYYKKYVNYNFISSDIFVLLNFHDQLLDGKITINLLRNNHIKYLINNDPLNSKNIDKLSNKIRNKYDFIFVDMNITAKNKDLLNVRNDYGFPTVFSSIVLSFIKLNTNGNMIIYIPNMTNRLFFNFISYLSLFFNGTFIYNSDIIDYYVHWDIIILKNYNGNININKLMDIIDKLYYCDPSGGFNFEVTDNHAKKILDITYKSSNPPKCYINQVVQYNNDSLYKKYCEFIKIRYDAKINVIYEILNLHYTKNIKETITTNIILSISYLKKIGMEIPEWIDNNGINDYFKNSIITLFTQETNPFIEQFIRTYDNVTISVSDSLKYNRGDNQQKLLNMSESVYKYIDKLNYNKYKSIELFINKYQKNLQNFLFDAYNINMNGRIVSRAWIKMYELYGVTKYFDNLNQDTIKAFHICEAPGNFISSTMYYIKHRTNIKHYQWNAQTLYSSDIGDVYGFIKNTSDNWDYGKDKSGDITNYNNLLYYYNKYKGVDSLIGDCGKKWSRYSDPKKELGVHQLLYALLLPRKGGNFIIKTFSLNFNKQFLSLLYVAVNLYENVYIYRSSRNLWSPEIYIVGINKNFLNNADANHLLMISKNLEKGIITYPVNYLPAEFGLEFEFYGQKVAEMFFQIKKLFVYFTRNEVDFKKNQSYLIDSINKKNELWILEHMNHLENIKNEYKQHSESIFDKFMKLKFT